MSVYSAEDWTEALSQFGYKAGLTRQDIVYWDGHGKAEDVRKRAIKLAALRNERCVEIRAALIKCRDQFQFYADEHRAAGKIEKAATNQTFADMCNEALGNTEGDA